MLEGRNVVVGVSGSIASYKACDLVRFLQKKGANVRVVMTPQATEFVGKLTFQALTNDTVFVNWNDGQTGLEHITLARWADVFVIAPATANTTAKIRYGMADDFLTSMALAYDRPIIFALAMNTKMFENPATQESIRVLKERGHLFVEPAYGVLACGEEGAGRLADIEDIYLEILRSITNHLLKGKNILITAGATREFFDPIRYISNASSGLMGYSLAKAAYAFGAQEVTLISAPTHLTAPSQIKKIDVVSALDMYEKVMQNLEGKDIIIMNAAVADFRPKEESQQKLKKDRESLNVDLIQNPDILRELGDKKRENQVLVGFAAESEHIIENAKQKLIRKNLDFIVANPVSIFNKDIYNGILISKESVAKEIVATSKEKAAFEIIKYIAEKISSSK